MPRTVTPRLVGAALVLTSLCAFPALATTHPVAPKRPASKATPAAKHVVAAPRRSPVAPADEYFGRLKMSVLGLRNKVRDLGLDVDVHPEHGSAVLSTAIFVEDALRDWSRKYPRDGWLPRYAYALVTVYERIPGDEARRRAVAQLNYIVASFPASPFARVCRSKLVATFVPDPTAVDAASDADIRLALLNGKLIPTPAPLVPPGPTLTPTPEPAAPPLIEIVPPTASEAGASPQPLVTTLP